MTRSPTGMRRHIAFLRAINVGGHTVKMGALRGHFEALGLANVATFIASGNVIFETADSDTAALEATIEAHLQKALGYAVKTFIRSPSELAAIAAYRPFPPAEPDGADAALTVAFLSAPLGNELQQRVMALKSPTDDFHAYGRELYWRRRPPISASTFSGAVLEKTVGMPATLRNITTVRRLAASYGAAV